MKRPVTDMKKLFTLAWRNIWRNPGRSGTLLIAIIAGLWAGVMVTGISNGMLQQRMDYLIESEITHAQIHHPEFLAEKRSSMFIPNYKEINSFLQEDDRVKSFTNRALAEGMLQSPVRTSGVTIRGLDPQKERETTTFHENLTEGEYLDTDMRNPLLMGETLIDEHNMNIGDRVVLRFENAENELVSAAFNIAGLFNSASAEFDRRNVLVKDADLSDILADQFIVHEIAIMLEDEKHSDVIVEELNQKFDQIKARSWQNISPELNTLVTFGGFMLLLVTIIVMTALGFGILNTMLMALFERMRELGMLISIGMSRAQVFFLILLEAIMLSLSGAAVGILAAIVTIGYLGERGINLEMYASGAAEVGFPSVIYPMIETGEFVDIVVIVIVITILAAIYPALKAFGINPLEVEKE